MQIKIFYHVNELPHWREVFDSQWRKMKASGLVDAASEINLCINGRTQTFYPLVQELNTPALRLISVHSGAELCEYPTLSYLKVRADMLKVSEPYAAFYMHHKGITRFGSPCIDQWRDFLDWAAIERWEECYAKLKHYDVVGPNWETIPWPHFSGNMWWATSDYLARLPKLLHPMEAIEHHTANKRYQFTNEGHWRFDHEAWIGSANPNYFEIAKSFDEGGKHYYTEYPSNLYREKVDGHVYSA